jgi:tRNA(Ser,Leu) C12 N-acetylase TAN1
MIDWNAIVTVRSDFARALSRLRDFGIVETTDLHNVVAMCVSDPRELLEQLAQVPADEHVFTMISHVVPITHKVWFANADELESKARDIVLGFAPMLGNKSVHVRMHRRGHKGEIHELDTERRLGAALLDELERCGTPGRVEFDDPDAVIAIETLRDEAGLALWTRDDLERYPFLRTSIDGHARKHGSTAVPAAPSRSLMQAAREVSGRSGGGHRASAREVTDLLGELDALVIEKIVATGATVDEIAEAASAIEDEEGFGEMSRTPSSPREAEVRAILEELVFEDIEDREAESEVARV